MQGLLDRAVVEYSRALERLPDDVRLLNRAAWILATSRDDAVRDGARARALAERAVQLTFEKDAESLDLLGAALAETGAFEDARRVTREAVEIARGTADRGFVEQLQERLKTYERGKPFRDPTG